jgi:hypothetical protein
LVKEPSRPLPESLNEVFPPPTICSQVEKAGIGVPFLDVRDPGALLFSRLLYHQPTQDAFFELRSQVELRSRE